MRRFIGVLGVSVMALTGCASLSTAPDEQGIRYSGPWFLPQAVEFKNCQPPSQQDFGAPGDERYTYPAGQRTYKFSNDPGSDSPPLTASAPSPGGGQPISMSVTGTITFTPNFTDCDQLRQFHEQIGIKFEAWTPEGWGRMLSVYLKDIADRAIDNEALKYDWVQLTSNAESKAAWEKAVTAAIPGLVEAQAGGNYFTINGVILQRPELPPNIQAAIAETESARQQAATAQQVQNAAANFPGGVEAYQAFLQAQAVNEAIRTGQVQVMPIPQGSPVIVQPGQ